MNLAISERLYYCCNHRPTFRIVWLLRNLRVWMANCVSVMTEILHLYTYTISCRCLLLLSCIIVSDQIVNSVCWSHALVNGPTSKMPASDGGLCIGQPLMMWSAVCSGSPHSHAALSASPHFFMDALYRPTPVRSRFRVVHCFRLRSSPLTPSPGSDTAVYSGGSGCFPLLLPRCRNPRILPPVLRDDT